VPTHASEVESGRPRKPEPRGRSAPEKVTESNHINVAFPFSRIKVQDPSDELRDLAALVTDLITALEATTGGQLKKLRQRSEELAGRLN
jgi:hypothetical protein